MTNKFVVQKEIHISSGVIPVGRQLRVGEFGFTKSRLEEMEAVGMVKALSSGRASRVVTRGEDTE